MVGPSNLDHDYYMVRLSEKLDVNPKKDEGGTAFAHRLFGEAMSKGVAFQIIGGLVMPADVIDDLWTEAIANETAAFMRTRTDHDDKLVISAMLASLLIGFFVNALVSSASSETSSTEESKDSERQPEETGTAPTS